jgi:Mg-chelatase subunit ChlD
LFTGDYGNRNKLRACNQDFGFVIDSSASVKNHWAEQKSFIKKLIEPIVISPSGGRAAVTTFSNQAALLITFSDHTTTAQFEYALDDLPYWGSTTRINLGLEVALEEMFQENNGMRSDEQQTLFLITDGQQTGVDFDEYRQRFNKAGIRIVVIGVGNVRHRDLRHMVNDIGDLYFAKDFDILLSEPFIKSINLCGGK